MGTLFVIAFYFFDVIRVAQNEGVVNYYSYSIAVRQYDIDKNEPEPYHSFFIFPS